MKLAIRQDEAAGVALVVQSIAELEAGLRAAGVEL